MKGINKQYSNKNSGIQFTLVNKNMFARHICNIYFQILLDQAKKSGSDIFKNATAETT